MADMMGLLRLPALQEGTDCEELCAYVQRLTELLRYILSHLDEENMSEQAAEKLTMAGNKQDSESLQQALTRATRLITGNRGGYVLLHDGDGDGKPDEILILDTPDKDTAQQVWRWNGAGLGHSATGYAGPYTTAITQDGAISADMITTGTLNAALLQVINLTAQMLRSQDGDFLLQVEGARFQLKENGEKRIDLRSDVENGGYLEIAKGTSTDGQYSLLFADSLVVGGHRANANQATGTIFGGSLRVNTARGQSLILSGTDPWLRLYDSAGRERLGFYANDGKLCLYDANGTKTLEIGPAAHFQTLSINGMNYEVLVRG